MPTIKDVAREAGVSIATVSYVLNNKTDSISDDTKHHVLATAKRIGYTPNVTARNLRFSQTRLIGYAWHDVPSDQVNSVMDRFTYHLAHAAENEGYHILTFTHSRKDPSPVYDELIRTRRLDAFILSATDRDDARVQLLHEAKFPFACFGRGTADTLYVDVDGTEGVRMAVEHLVDLGHRKIAMIAWEDDATASHYRREGFVQVMNSYGLEIPDGFITYGRNGEAHGRNSFQQLYELPQNERPTALVCSSDLEAIGAMNAAEEAGVEVGKDISIIGFDDVPMSQYLRPALTTLRQPIEEVATLLISMLKNSINKKVVKQPQLIIPPELIIRASTGPAPDS
jgi:DNA-binding LacI/PurR family transcriptional regulator